MLNNMSFILIKKLYPVATLDEHIKQKKIAEEQSARELQNSFYAF